MSEVITKFICPNCGWTHDYVAMKPECPVCLTHLNWITGTQEEIDKVSRDYRSK